MLGRTRSDLTEHELLGISVELASPMFDLRLMGITSLGYYLEPEEFWYELGVLAATRMNLSPLYSMELGLRLGISNSGYEDDSFSLDDYFAMSTEFVFSLQLSLLSLRFGSQRNFELTLWHALGFSRKTSIQNGISFTWIFVGS